MNITFYWLGFEIDRDGDERFEYESEAVASKKDGAARVREMKSNGHKIKSVEYQKITLSGKPAIISYINQLHG